MADGLERGRQQHERDRGSPVRRRRHPGPEAERGGPGHAPRDERVAVAASREQHRADPRTENERHQRARRTPTARRRVLQPADDERDRERQCAESPRVEVEPAVGRDVRHERRQRDEGHDTERDVDGEEAAPRPGRGQSTGDERADRAADPAGRPPQTDREPAPVGVEDHVDDRQRRREAARRRDALQGASDEQHGEVARDRTDRGRRGEQDDADEQEAARADAVGDASDEDQRRREPERGDADDGAERAARRAEVAAELWEEHGDAVEVRRQRDQRQAQCGEPRATLVWAS